MNTAFAAGIPVTFAALALFALAGCADENTTSPATDGFVQGHMWLTGDTVMAGEEPVAQAELALLDGDRFVFVGSYGRTDANGYYRLGPVPFGDYYVVPFGDGLIQSGYTARRVRVPGGGTVTHDVHLSPPVFESFPGVITGEVRDGDTGALLPGVFVTQFWSDPGVLLALGGFLDAAITGDDGRFSILSTLDYGAPELSGPFGLAPLLFSRPGYMPQVIAPQWIDLGDPVDSFDVAALLFREGPHGTIEGTVVRGGVPGTAGVGDPLAGVPVMIDFYSWDWGDDTVSVGGKTAIPVLGRALTTAADGSFRFTNLRPGLYRVEPGYLPDDGYVISSGSRGRSAELSDGQTITLDPVALVPAIEPRDPAPGAVLTTPPAKLRWSLVPGIERYEVSVTDEYFFGVPIWVQEPEFTLPWLGAPDAIPPLEATLRWFVEAYVGTTMVAGFEWPVTFQVDWDGE